MPVEGSWALLSPLVMLLALLATLVLGVHFTLGLRVVGIVMIVVPAIALVWAALQHRSGKIIPRQQQERGSRRMSCRSFPAIAAKSFCS